MHDVITGHADEDDTSASDGSDYSVDDHAVEEGARAEEDSQGFARRGTTPSTEVTRNLQQVTDDDIAAGNAYPQDDGSRGSGYPSDYRNDRDGYDRSGLAGGSDAVPARGVTGDSNGRHDTGVTSEKMNIGLMIIEVIVALVLGVIVFRCFTTMWVTYSRPVTTVVAMVVTGAIVGAVHAILRERDKPIMLLAAVVGLALTCGPYLVVT